MKGDSTRAVHGGEREQRTSDSLTTPIHQTSTFAFADSEEVRAYQEGRKRRDEYGRYGNPTWRAVEGMSCVRPIAPVGERAVREKPLSSRISAWSRSGSTDARRA